jgi:hypothetical protein
MTESNQDVEVKNPTQLLRDQVVLLTKIEQNLADIQKTQQEIRKSLKDLHQATYKIWERQGGQARVSVADVHMSIGAMIEFMIKWAIAAVPAAIFLSIVAAVLVFLFSLFLALLGY